MADLAIIPELILLVPGQVVVAGDPPEEDVLPPVVVVGLSGMGAVVFIHLGLDHKHRHVAVSLIL
jgi:hypothetical protein